MTMIMVDSLKKSGGPWAARRWLKLFAGVLSVSAAPGGQPVVEIPSERGCSPHIAIVHGEFDVEDDPGVHGVSLAWLTRLAVRPRLGRGASGARPRDASTPRRRGGAPRALRCGRASGARRSPQAAPPPATRYWPGDAWVPSAKR